MSEKDYEPDVERRRFNVADVPTTDMKQGDLRGTLKLLVYNRER